MTSLKDNQKRGLPPSPAPPRRSANPWKFSETARKPEPRPEPVSQQLLDELMRQAPEEEAHAQEEAPPPAAAVRARPGLWFFVVAGVVILIALRVFSDASKGGDWMKAIGPLLVIAFIAHGWWRARQRREAVKQKSLQAGERGR